MATSKQEHDLVRDQIVGVMRNAELRPEMEVGMTVCGGNADIVLNHPYPRLIEIKRFDEWRHGVGQLLVYARTLKNHHKVLYLFGEEHYSGTLGWDGMVALCKKKWKIELRKTPDIQALVASCSERVPESWGKRRKGKQS